jgi:hypothetical protein
MKAKNVNGKIIIYNNIPKNWGNVIGVNYMSNDELKTLGFYDVVEPSRNRSQKYGIIYFDSDNEVFTYPVENITFSQTVAQLKEEKIESLKELYNRELAKTDWYVVREAEGGTAVPGEIATERGNLRTECATHEANINAKTTKAQVVDYELPSFSI